jgi:phosphotransacetylase
MRFIGSIIEKLQRHPKRMVFPEGAEPRVLQAARQYYSLRLGVPILLGDRARIKQAAEALHVSLEGMRIINPEDSEDLPSFVRRFELLRKFKNIKDQEAREAMMIPNYYGAMMVAMHQADGFVSGASEYGGHPNDARWRSPGRHSPAARSRPRSARASLARYARRG